MTHLTELQLDQIATLFAHKSSLIYPDFDEQDITWDKYLEGWMTKAISSSLNSVNYGVKWKNQKKKFLKVISISRV